MNDKNILKASGIREGLYKITDSRCNNITHTDTIIKCMKNARQDERNRIQKEIRGCIEVISSMERDGTPKPSAKEKIWKARQFRCQCGHSDRMHPDNYCAVSGCHCVKFDTRPKNKPEFKSGGLSTCRGRHGSKTEDLRMVEPKPETKGGKNG